ncbi:MAG: hypothetical protein JWR37_3107 [Mycobacterium sp.]|jgi:hypothetical protein|nr:hypothetical protein [Mycobacterium sp.]
MTGLGAAIYGGFFALAALWLLITPDGGDEQAADESSAQGQRPVRSNSTSTS